MEAPTRLDEQYYQQDVLSALLKWTLLIGPPMALLNLLDSLPDFDWTALAGTVSVLFLALIAARCLRLVQRRQLRRATRTYVISGMAIMAVVVFIAAKPELLLGAMGMSVFVVMATFFEPPRAALRWGMVSAVLYEAGLLARELVHAPELGLHGELLSLYIVPPIVLLFLALAGGIMNAHLSKALAASEEAGRDLARAYVEVEQRVTERTHDLVKERYRLNTALRELTEARDQAESASRAKSAFLANMSHELRTPLTTILGYTTLIEHDPATPGNPTLASDLSRISIAGNHLLELISDVLDLAEVEAGTMQLHPAPFEVAELIAEAVATVRPSVEKNENRLDVRYDGSPDVVTLDRAKVRQILVNLLSNAAKFTGHGVITLEVTHEEPTNDQSQCSSFVVFRVSDTGIGIAPDQLRQLFHPFTQGDMAVKHMYGGTGLGLAICHRYCQLMGGEIAVTSAEGQGATFTVRLPPSGAPAATTPSPTVGAPNSTQPATATVVG